MPHLEAAQHTAVGLPLRLGGLGFRRLEWTAEAAYIGACLQSAHYLQDGFGTRPALATSQISGGFQNACTRLHDKYGFLVLDSLGLDPEDVARQPRKKVQKTLADRVHKRIADSWKEIISGDARAVVDSTTTVDARSGANDWLAALPATQQLAMPDDAIRLLLRSRLRLDVADAGSMCAYSFRRSSLTCGIPLNATADHAFSCCSALVNRRHNVIRDQRRRIYGEAGAFSTLTERPVPELGPDTSIVADLKIREGPGAPLKYGDVVICHPIDCVRGQWIGQLAGQAAADGEKLKQRKYTQSALGRQVNFVPLFCETYPRWGQAAIAELRKLAKMRAYNSDAAGAVDPDAVANGALIRWRRELSVALQLCNAAIIAECIGFETPGGVKVTKPDVLGTSTSDLILER